MSTHHTHRPSPVIKLVYRSACLLAIAMLALPLAGTASTVDSAPGLHDSVTFTTYPASATLGEMLQRLLSPFAARRIKARFANQPGAMNARVFDQARQRFAVYVPPGPPPAKGYALLVFIPPWNAARVPVAWIPELNRTHTLFVTAADSGNSAAVFNRREPLALLAAHAMEKRFPVDGTRVYVGGFSGGSRVALRVALGYPDVFRGALLDAGSDPIGTAAIPLPPAHLLHRFQQSSRIVFVTGENDEIRQMQLAHARPALRHWCVFDVASLTLLHTGHDLADGAGFARALDALGHPSPPDPAALTRCRAANETALQRALRTVRTAATDGDRVKALRTLQAIDAHFGGLAAPDSVALLRQLRRPPGSR